MKQGKKDKTIKFIDLFSGCGGLGLGFEQAGFTPVFADDIDPVCLNTYLLNRNIEKKRVVNADIYDILNKFSDYSPLFDGASLVLGGPPCQGFSMANRQRVIDDPRNRLYKAFILFIKKANPSIFVMENVRGMFSRIGEIEEDFKALLDNRYKIAYSLFNAVDFGVPQYRERLILIGCRNGTDPQELIDKIKESAKKAPRFVLKDAIGDLPALEPNPNKNNSSIENDQIGYFKTAYSYSSTPFIEFINGALDLRFLFNHKNRYNNPRDIKIFATLPQGANSLDPSIADIMPYKRRNDIFKDKYFKLVYDEPCKTITSHMKFDCNMYIHPTQARGLSPREAARIQTFPDDFVFYGAPNSWYKQIGNAVPVKLAQAIAEVIYPCL